MADGFRKVLELIVAHVEFLERDERPDGWLQALPKDGVPITQWPDRDAAWQNVTEGLRRTITSLALIDVDSVEGFCLRAIRRVLRQGGVFTATLPPHDVQLIINARAVAMRLPVGYP